MRSQIEQGKIRADLDPRLTVLSIASLAICPFLLFPLTSRLFGVQHETQFVERLIAHTTQLLAHGVENHSALV